MMSSTASSKLTLLPTQSSHTTIDLYPHKPLRAIAQRLSEKFTSLDSLIDCLLTSLVTFGLIDHNNVTLEKCDPKTVATPSSSFWMRELPRIHAGLLTFIAVDWRPTLIQHNHWDSLYYAWFGLSHQPLKISHVSRRIGSKMSYVAIESMICCLSSRTSSTYGGALHPDTITTIEELMNGIFKTYSLYDWYLAFFENEGEINSRHALQQNEEWCRFINTLFSVPDKITNAAHQEGKLIEGSGLFSDPLRLDRTSFLVQLSLHIEGLIQNLAKSNEPIDVSPITHMISKLIRIGFVKVDINSVTSLQKVDFLSSIWHVLLSALIRQDEDSNAYSRLWIRIISDLPRDELRTYLASFLAHAQIKMCLNDLELDLEEASCAQEQAISELYNFYFGTLVDDDKGIGSEIAEVVQDLIVDRSGWNIGTARSISRWLAHKSTGEEVRMSLAKRALGKLSSKAQIAHGSASHHTFLLLIFLLNACHIANKSCTIDFSSNVDFLEGVHLSLGSLRRRIRLLGMLMAELVSTFEVSSNHPKVLKHNFGAEVWNSDDDDTNLCKSIRVLVENWSSLVVVKSTSWTRFVEEKVRETRAPTTTFVWPISTKSEERGEGCEVPMQFTRVPPVEEHSYRTSPSHHPQKKPSGENPSLLADIQRLAIGPITTHQKKPLIQVLDSSSPELKPYAISDEDLAELNGDIIEEANGSHQVDQMFSSRKKGKIKIPVYIHDLTDYFKDAENYEKIDIALKSADQLIRRKARWGTELMEYGVELTLALLLLQDNFDHQNFALHRQAALTALVASVPQKVAPCLIEQLFYHQYSVTQRICMLNALILGAKELAEPRSQGTETVRFENQSGFTVSPQAFQSQLTSSQTNSLKSILDSRSDLLSDMSRDLTKNTLERVRSKQDPDKHGLQARSAKTTRISSALEKSRRERTTTQLEPAQLPSLATEYFIMPMINRMWIYLNEASSAQIDKGRGQPYLGAGWAILLQPMLLSRFVQSLTVLLYLSRSSLDFLNVYMIESLVLAMKLRANMLESNIGGEEEVESALLELILMVLDITISLDGGWRLFEEPAEKDAAFSPIQGSCGGLLGLIGDWAGSMVEVEQHRGGGELTRTGLAAVGIVVMIERLRKTRVQSHQAIC
ncbi:hypothetical protein CROQUDRAFT_719920 [Cronartium quercuum f. sp. fusiforme G11]|uniref:Telomere length regulation protein conserved domain-containing protein n=1 Tax=Cronartium quercuum f. sp. fusiforme G11 TaxID=708437 RepID=A0A9P6THU9_9BASI|nr:hypothetical protein CROQUDRAFT_719920 [Cronartium quercuum f. sp. fusiforme G11]